MEKIYEKMRPCILKIFEKGAVDWYEFDKMRFGICVELKRLGVELPIVKTSLLDWYKKSQRKFGQGDAQRNLCDYAEWVFKKECKIGCRGLKDYCLFPQGGCVFNKKDNWDSIILPFPVNDAISFLEKEYKPHGYIMGLLIQVLFRAQVEKNAPLTVFIGVREIRTRLNNDNRYNLDEMTILRTLNRLEEAGIFKITRGKSGTFGRPANGYTFLPWTRPELLTPTNP